MSTSAEATPADRLRESFRSLPHADHAPVWDTFYRQDFHPWDRSGPSVALSDLLSQRHDLVPPAQELDHRGNPLRDTKGAVIRRTALVPGCGRGHDVLLLARLGYDVWGLDVSEAALDKAREVQEQDVREKGARGEEEGIEMGSVNWLAADFFADDWAKGLGSEGSGMFDLIFDYTFLCALPPDARPKWSKRMSDLLAPGGRLVCLEFPSGKPLSMGGPPWGVTPELYEALLGAPGETVDYDADGNVASTPSPKPRDDAIHRLCLIKPLRTHEAGTKEDGSVSDFISVWSR